MRNAMILLAALLLPACSLPMLPFSGTAAPRESTVTRAVTPLQLEAADGTLCNAVRIGSARAATAAHCVETGAPFVLGDGATRIPVGSVLRNPAYALLDRSIAAGADLAVLTVSPDGGGEVSIAAIQPGIATILARTPTGARDSRTCRFLGRAGGLVELDCAIPLGWSGAPVVQDGALVGIVSSRGRGAMSGITQIADAYRLDSF